MVAVCDGRWMRELWLPPGQYEYLFVVDGEWTFDPNTTDYMPNLFGGMNAVMEVLPDSTCPSERRVLESPFLATRAARIVKGLAKSVECLASFKTYQER